MSKTTEQNNTTTGKLLKGVVTSDKMTDTITVKVDRYVKLPKYNLKIVINYPAKNNYTNVFKIYFHYQIFLYFSDKKHLIFIY
jgi:hypothetical protein